MSDSTTQNLYLRIAVAGAAEAEGEVDGLTLSLDRLGGASETTGKKIRSGGLFSALKSLKALMAGFGAYEAVKSYAAFTAQMTQLRTQTGATTAEMNLQTRALLSMAQSVATGPNSLAEGLYHLESAGIRGAKATNDLRIAAEGAKIGGANLTDTVTGLTAAMLAFETQGLTARSAMAALNATVGAGDMTFQDLNDALGTGVLATMKVLGLTINDFGAAMAVFGDNNIRGAAAANRLRMSLMTLVHPSTVAAAAMESIHLSTSQLATDLHSPNGLMVMLQDLHDHLQGLSRVQVEQTLASIFGGGKNSAGIMTLYTQMGRLQSKYNDIHKAQGTFNQDWLNTQKTLAFSLDQLKALGEVLLIRVGGALAGTVSAGAKLITWLAQGHGAASALRAVLLGLASAWTLNVVAMKLFGESATAASVATTVLNSDLIVTIASVTSLADVCDVLTMAIDAIPFVGWIALAVTAVIVLVQHWRTVVRAFQTGLDWIITHWKLLVTILSGPLAPLVWMGLHLKTVVHWFQDLWKWAVKAFDYIENKAKKVGGYLKYLNPVHDLTGVVSDITGAFANGGNTPTAGTFLVGERGPELINLPAGAEINPAGSQAVTAALNGSGSFPLEATIPIALSLDGKPFAQAVVHQSLQAQARS